MDPAYDPADPCAGCGICCDPVWLSMPMVEKAFRAGASDSYDAQFIREHLTFLEVGDRPMIGFTCDAFVDGRCTAYEARPKMCSEYPFYGRAPETAPLNSTCTFHDQVPGRRVLPLTVLP